MPDIPTYCIIDSPVCLLEPQKRSYPILYLQSSLYNCLLHFLAFSHLFECLIPRISENKTSHYFLEQTGRSYICHESDAKVSVWFQEHIRGHGVTLQYVGRTERKPPGQILVAILISSSWNKPTLVILLLICGRNLVRMIVHWHILASSTKI